MLSPSNIYCMHNKHKSTAAAPKKKIRAKINMYYAHHISDKSQIDQFSYGSHSSVCITYIHIRVHGLNMHEKRVHRGECVSVIDVDLYLVQVLYYYIPRPILLKYTTCIIHSTVDTHTVSK